jgi:hypothetical protein
MTQCQVYLIIKAYISKGGKIGRYREIYKSFGILLTF